jgi:integrase
MASKRLRGGKWRYTIRKKSLLPEPIYLTFDTEDEGDRYVAHLEALLDRGIVPDGFKDKTLKKITVTQAISKYLSEGHPSKSDALLLTGLQPTFARMQISDVTFTWVMNWITNMKRERKVAPATIRHQVGAMARCFDWMKTYNPGLIPVNNFRDLPRNFAAYNSEDERIAGVKREDIERDRRLSPEEEREIRNVLFGGVPKKRSRPLKASDMPALRLVFELALESAMRLSEMYTLAREQIDIDRRTIFLEKTKNGDKRQVPITTVAGKALQEYLGALDKGEVMMNPHDPSLIFPWWDGDESTLRDVTSVLSKRFGRIFEMAGCDDLRFHDLRHEATSRLYERTELSDLEISKITGHKSMSMLRRYANLRASELASRLW